MGDGDADVARLPVLPRLASLVEWPGGGCPLEEYYYIKRALLPHPEDVACAPVEDGAMEPALWERSLVGVDMAPRDVAALNGRVVAARDGEGVVLRRVVSSAAGVVLVPDAGAERRGSVVSCAESGPGRDVLGVAIFAFRSFAGG